MTPVICPCDNGRLTGRARKGTVKSFSDPKGFGLITPGDGSMDVFVRHTAISSEGFRSFSEEGKVAFETEQGAKGP